MKDDRRHPRAMRTGDSVTLYMNSGQSFAGTVTEVYQHHVVVKDGFEPSYPPVNVVLSHVEAWRVKEEA